MLWVAPKFEPVMVTWLPLWEIEVTFGVRTVKAKELDQAAFWTTCTTPDLEPEATLATMVLSLQLTTTPGRLPTHTRPLPRTDPKREPLMVVWSPAVAVVEDTLDTVGGATVTLNRAFAVARSLPVVTITLVVPVEAVGEIVRVAVRCVASVTVTLLAVTPGVAKRNHRHASRKMRERSNDLHAAQHLAVTDGTVTVKLTPLLAKPPLTARRASD